MKGWPSFRPDPTLGQAVVIHIAADLGQALFGSQGRGQEEMVHRNDRTIVDPPQRSATQLLFPNRIASMAIVKDGRYAYDCISGKKRKKSR
jgi:hypothetical protein